MLLLCYFPADSLKSLDDVPDADTGSCSNLWSHLSWCVCMWVSGVCPWGGNRIPPFLGGDHGTEHTGQVGGSTWDD